PEEVTVWTNDSKAIDKARKLFLRQTLNVTKTSEKGKGKLRASVYVGPEVRHKYIIVNSGYSPIIDAKVRIMWPRSFDVTIPITVLKEIATSGDIECEDVKPEDTLQYVNPFVKQKIVRFFSSLKYAIVLNVKILR
ncbi:hypothetical protein Anas_10782, partial [Armadillidium nasatum]